MSAQDDIGRLAQQRRQLGRCILVVEILGQHRGTGDRLDGRDVDADHDTDALPGLRPCLHALDRDLGPATGGRAKIDDAGAGLEVELIIELQQLEGRTRAIAAFLAWAT